MGVWGLGFVASLPLPPGLKTAQDCFLPPELLESSIVSDSELIEQLQRATSGLLWTSESDSPFVAFVWEKPPSLLGNFTGKRFAPRDLLQHLELPPDTPVETVEFDRFFATATREEDWHDEATAEEV
ncbi:MAG: hypothetical protein D6728_18265, partial [Cyanobacteria bacterium J055]